MELLLGINRDLDEKKRQTPVTSTTTTPFPSRPSSSRIEALGSLPALKTSLPPTPPDSPVLPRALPQLSVTNTEMYHVTDRKGGNPENVSLKARDVNLSSLRETLSYTEPFGFVTEDDCMVLHCDESTTLVQDVAKGNNVRLVMGQTDIDAEYCVCGKPANNLCSSCNLKGYCSLECQRGDWSRHKSACKAAVRERKAARASNTEESILEAAKAKEAAAEKELQEAAQREEAEEAAAAVERQRQAAEDAEQERLDKEAAANAAQQHAEAEAAAQKEREEAEKAALEKQNALEATAVAKAEAPVAIPPKAQLDGGKISLSENIQFEGGKAIIKAESYAICDQVLDILKDTTFRVEISGHTADVGSAEEKNQLELELSKHRAAAVKDYLVERGIEAGRLDTVGFGDSKPVAPNNTKEGRKLNRRVEFRVVPT